MSYFATKTQHFTWLGPKIYLAGALNIFLNTSTSYLNGFRITGSFPEFNIVTFIL
jgi:hypothetical protein